MNQRMWAAAALVSACAMLGACTDAAIKEVKETVIPKSDFSYGEYLDKPKGCKSTEWTSSEDSNGRATVVYTCTTELTQATLDAAIAKNTLAAKSWRNQAEGEWEYSWKHFERHQRRFAEIAESERATLQLRLEDMEAELPKAVQSLEQAKARTPESYMGNPRYGMNEYLLREGESRKQSGIVQAQARIEQLNASIEKTRHELEQAANLVGAKDAYGFTADDYARELQAMEALKDEYFRAADDVDAKLLQQVRDHESAERKREVKLQILFAVPKRSPPQITSAQWVVDGEPGGHLDVFSLAIALAKPSFFTETIQKYWNGRVVVEGMTLEGSKRFGFRCGPTAIQCRRLSQES